MSEQTRFYGKYRGMVFNNIDPMQTGRIQVQVPDVLGPGKTSWAMPCVPFAGKQSGVFVLPQIGDGVWVEFEQGDIDYPIWVGGFWGSTAEVPALALWGCCARLGHATALGRWAEFTSIGCSFGQPDAAIDLRPCACRLLTDLDQALD